MRRTEDTEAELGPVLEFMRLVWGLNSALESASRAMERDLGVTGPQRLVIRVIGLRPGLAPKELATVLRLHPSTLTGLLKRLEAKGLVTRSADPEDGRRARLALTADGQRVNRLRAGTVENAVRKALTGVPEDRLEATRWVVSRLANEIGGVGGDEAEAVHA